MANEIDIFLNKIYQDFFSREPDEEGYNHYYNLFKTKQIDQNKLINIFKNSDEYKKIQMNKLALLVKDRSNILKNIKIKYIGYIGTTGYCDWTSSIVYNLVKFGANIEFECKIFQDHVKNFEDASLNLQLLYYLIENKLDHYDIVIIHSVPEIWQEICIEERKKNKTVKIFGITIWECDKLSLKWKNIIDSSVDYVIVPTEWNKQIFIESVKKPVFVLNYIMNEQISNSTKKSIIDIDEKTYVFYSIGQWNARKRLAILIRDFLTTFTQNDDVALFIKTFLADYTNDQKIKLSKFIDSIIAEYPNAAKVIYNLDALSDEEIQLIHKRGNCYVSPCTSEGIGLGACNAVMYGNHVIITDYGGQIEYLNNVDLIKSKMVPALMCCNYDLLDHSKCEKNFCSIYSMFDPRTQKWAEPDSDDLKRMMLTTYQNKLKGNPESKKYIIENFNSEKIINQFINILKSTNLFK